VGVPVAQDDVVLVHSAASGVGRFEVSVSVLRIGGIFVAYGYSGGQIPPISLPGQPHGARLVRIRPDGPELTAGQWRQRAEQVIAWIKDSTLDVLIDCTYPQTVGHWNILQPSLLALAE
jgi:NADPH:quinone reductase-like Zn-dependent oxidoreductase